MDINNLPKHLKQYSQQVSDLEGEYHFPHSQLIIKSSDDDYQEYDEEDDYGQDQNNNPGSADHHLEGISRRELADKIKQMKDKIRQVQQEQKAVISIEDLKVPEVGKQQPQQQQQVFQKEDLRDKINQMKQAIAAMQQDKQEGQSDMFITEESEVDLIANASKIIQKPRNSRIAEPARINNVTPTVQNIQEQQYQSNHTTFGGQKKNQNILILNNQRKNNHKSSKQEESEGSEDEVIPAMIESEEEQSPRMKISRHESQEKTPPSTSRDNRQQRKRAQDKKTFSPSSSSIQDAGFPLNTQTTSWYQGGNQQMPYLKTPPQPQGLSNPFLLTQQHQPLYTQQPQYPPQLDHNMLTSMHIPTHTHTPSSISSSLYYPGPQTLYPGYPPHPYQMNMYQQQQQQHKPPGFPPHYQPTPDLSLLQHLSQQQQQQPHAFIAHLQQRVAELERELHSMNAGQSQLVSSVKAENLSLLQRNEELMNRMEGLQQEMNEQRDFYENALEERFNQMEQFEQECLDLRDQLKERDQEEAEGTRKNGVAIMKEKEEWKRKQEQREVQLEQQAMQRQQEMAERLEDLEVQLREAMVLSEKRAEENYNLKTKIDQQRGEIEKNRKKTEVMEDQVIQREGELRQAREDIEKLQKRQKTMYSQNDQSVNGNLKQELVDERSVNAELRALIESLENQNEELNYKLIQRQGVQRNNNQLQAEYNPTGQASSGINRALSSNVVDRKQPMATARYGVEVQKIMQTHANQHKRVASNLYGQSEEYAPLARPNKNELSQNRENQLKHTAFTDEPQLGSARQPIGGRSRLQSAKQNQSPMKQLLYNEPDMQQDVDESEINEVADAAVKYQLPPSFFQDMGLPSGNGQQNFPPSSHRNIPLVTKPKNTFAVGESGSSQYSGLPSARIQQSGRQRPISSNAGFIPQEERDREKKQDQIKSFEAQLLQIQIDQRKLQNELDKLPESGPRTIAQRKRREEVERDLAVASKNISGIRNKLRELDALRK